MNNSNGKPIIKVNPNPPKPNEKLSKRQQKQVAREIRTNQFLKNNPGAQDVYKKMSKEERQP